MYVLKRRNYYRNQSLKVRPIVGNKFNPKETWQKLFGWNVGDKARLIVDKTIIVKLRHKTINAGKEKGQMGIVTQVGFYRQSPGAFLFIEWIEPRPYTYVRGWIRASDVEKVLC